MKKGLSKGAVKLLVTLAAAVLAATIIIHHNPLADQQEELVKKVAACLIIVGALAIFYRFYDRLVTLPVELWQSRALIWKLAKNDFKNRYAGSYLGRVWAFTQPVVTVLLYWFVFGHLMMADKKEVLTAGVEAPYVLWLTAGLVPWFYFSEAFSNGTTSLLEYSYLVKKVVFKISIIPIVKLIAASFIHIFFVGFMLVVYFCYGYKPDIYLLQLIYFSFCLFMLVLALSYATCAIAVFFRDLMQIINICLQIGMWATPILWNISMLDNEPVLQWIIKCNPIFYVVNGYRDAMFTKTWFWQDFYSTAYFWIVTVVLFGLGALIFRRLKVHFADVL
ncbi:MAG: ABC transporter permease [Lachnospiraceae bacterium]|nr:ABC transporter permease [Lachnospiraceae bacterium]